MWETFYKGHHQSKAEGSLRIKHLSEVFCLQIWHSRSSLISRLRVYQWPLTPARLLGRCLVWENDEKHNNVALSRRLKSPLWDGLVGFRFLGLVFGFRFRVWFRASTDQPFHCAIRCACASSCGVMTHQRPCENTPRNTGFRGEGSVLGI